MYHCYVISITNITYFLESTLLSFFQYILSSTVLNLNLNPINSAFNLLTIKFCHIKVMNPRYIFVLKFVDSWIFMLVILAD